MSEPRRFTRWLEGASTYIMGHRIPSKPEPDIERGPGLFQRRRGEMKEGATGNGDMETKNGITVTKVSGLESYYTWYEVDGVVHSAVNSLAEQSVGQGYHTRIDDEEPDEAKELVDELGKALQLDAMNKNVCINMLIAGFTPVETRISKFPAKSVRKIIHPLSVFDFAQDKNNKLLWLRQKDPNSGMASRTKIMGKNLTWFVNNQIGNDLRGMSIIKPVESLLSTKTIAVDNMDAIIDRKLYPIAVWKSKRGAGPLKNNVTQVEAGEDLFFGNLTDEEMKPGGLFEIIEVQGDSKFWEYISYIDILIYKGLYAPDLFYWKDATLASSKELSDMTDRRVDAIQRDMKRALEQGFFDRLMKANKLDAEPKILWGIERTGTEDLQMESIIAELIRNGYFTEENATLLLKIMGLDVGQLGFTSDFEPDEDDERDDEVEPPIDDEDEVPPEDDEDDQCIHSTIR